jgi:hypothetical protein
MGNPSKVPVGSRTAPALRAVATTVVLSLVLSGVFVKSAAAGAATTPVNTVLPALSGSVVVGGVLSVSKGTWSNSPSSYGYQWENCNASGANCTPISGATSASYTVTLAAVGSTLRATVTARNAGGGASATSAASGLVPDPPAPVNTALPSITGAATIGSTLSASTGTWTDASSSFAYAWELCGASGASCTPINRATSKTETVTTSDVGGTLRVSVTASNVTGSTTATSLQSSVVPPPPAPVNTALPKISGTLKVSDTLSASTGTWSNSPTSYVYQWEDCSASGASCKGIAGAATSSYVLQISDAGATIRVVVTATNLGGSTAASSAASALVPTPPAPVNTVLPKISGTPEVGYTLSASSGTWLNSPTSYAYQWEDCTASGASCVVIDGATASTFVPVSSEAGSTLRVSVSALNIGGTVSVLSSPSAVLTVAVAPVNTVLPKISGTPEVGDTLSASSGTWSNNPISYGYQW